MSPEPYLKAIRYHLRSDGRIVVEDSERGAAAAAATTAAGGDHFRVTVRMEASLLLLPQCV